VLLPSVHAWLPHMIRLTVTCTANPHYSEVHELCQGLIYTLAWALYILTLVY
jgi:hypothetical protein